MKQPSSIEMDTTTKNVTERTREVLPNATGRMVDEAGHLPRGNSVVPRKVNGAFYRSSRTEEP